MIKNGKFIDGKYVLKVLRTDRGQLAALYVSYETGRCFYFDMKNYSKKVVPNRVYQLRIKNSKVTKVLKEVPGNRPIGRPLKPREIQKIFKEIDELLKDL